MILISLISFLIDESNDPLWKRALIAFEDVAEVYKAKWGSPAVIIYDNVNLLINDDPKILDILQDDAKKNADKCKYIAVFVSSEGAVPRRMEKRSAWSRAKQPPIEIGDLSKEESMKYLTEKRKINEKALELYELVGGRIIELTAVADYFLAGQSFEEIKKKTLYEAKKKFESAKLLKNQTHYEAGKQVINALLNSKEIDSDVFREIFTNEEEYNEVLKANVFAYHPSRGGTVSFQSRLIENYIRENSNIFVDLINLTPTNEFNSNYASTSKS
ncbi:hypothetical protein Glove_457g44 [Diversispora epigaea]|uniref:ATPase domain-containing protein n=1 Tax=Diversispora epigaea TaxID=1348612 RepID=A0A397GTB8_9GLOM|nr:hypothetical protein Glove_457g44 [Diversispora epigaea]